MTPAHEHDPWSAEATQPPPRRVSKAWWWGLGSCGAVVALGVLALLGFAIAADRGPETYVQSAHAVDARWKSFLVEHELLVEGEELLWFYSDGLFDADASGVFCTDRAVVTYAESDAGALESTRVAYGEITDVGLARGGSWIEPSVLRIDRGDASTVELELSRECDGDLSFEKTVRERWRRARPETSDEDEPASPR